MSPFPSGSTANICSMTTRRRVQELWRRGLSGAAISRELGISRSTVSYHLKRLGKPVDEKCNRRYDWIEVQRFYDEGRTVRECMNEFGFSSETWHSAVKRGALTSRPRSMPMEELLNARRSRGHLKVRLFSAGLKEARCEGCGIEDWLGAPLSLCLHHVNGDNQDNRLENLRILCPNCHSQTENFAGRNSRRAGARDPTFRKRGEHRPPDWQEAAPG